MASGAAWNETGSNTPAARKLAYFAAAAGPLDSAWSKATGIIQYAAVILTQGNPAGPNPFERMRNITLPSIGAFAGASPATPTSTHFPTTPPPITPPTPLPH